ncbi:MAG: Rod shape-determining protein MreD [Jatrophihabitantaceae bacterium]|nr:Rod shape-determining protein MreD [Jatrophihabitantaceae bacterium]
MVARVCAAIAVALTALLLQMTLVGPLAPWAPASLPAVVVAAVAITAGPGAGMSMGFSLGLLADLGSAHPVGVLALTWLGLGALVGRYADPRRARTSTITLAAIGAALAGIAGEVLLALVQSDAIRIPSLPRHLIIALVLDAALLVLVLPAARSILGRLRAPTLGIQRG